MVYREEINDAVEAKVTQLVKAGAVKTKADGYSRVFAERPDLYWLYCEAPPRPQETQSQQEEAEPLTDQKRAELRAHHLAVKKMTESRGELRYADALCQLFAEDPDLYRQYSGRTNRETRSGSTPTARGAHFSANDVKAVEALIRAGTDPKRAVEIVGQVLAGR